MFDNVEQGRTVDEAEFAKALPKLRGALLDAQFELLERRAFPLVVVIEGFAGAGRGDTLLQLQDWLDVRHVKTRALDLPTPEERERPPLWRFWRALPESGKTLLLPGSWYAPLLRGRTSRLLDKRGFKRGLEAVSKFERLLADDGALVVKFWLHASRELQRERLEAMRADPEQRWRLQFSDFRQLARRKRWEKAATKAIEMTSTTASPWVLVDGACPRHRALTIGNELLSALSARLAEEASRPARKPVPMKAPTGALKGPLAGFSPQVSLSRERFESKLPKVQARLSALARHRRFQSRSAVVVMEGMDAAGKGGAIRRIVATLDPRRLEVVPIAAPTPEERLHPYLWRFWRALPGRGGFTVFDRSWYGRVLVERVEGFASEPEWKRAFDEINEFERQLHANDTVVAKFWMQIDLDTQAARFKERTGFKRYKLTDEDWRNREKWSRYQQAASEMVARTSTPHAPWTLVPANDKHHARLVVLEGLCDALEASLDG